PKGHATARSWDGFYRTGCRVTREQADDMGLEGHLTEQNNRGGEKIAAEEVENLLIAHPQEDDAAVVNLGMGYQQVLHLFCG
ncbi:hypothetical protein ACV340_25455, partial [Pseudomonas aeruginosa]